MTEHHGKIWWSELLTRDPAAARDYYAEVAGWTFETMPMGEREYFVASRHGAPVAGIMDMTGVPGMDAVPPHWFTYVAVDDVDEAVRRTRARGGEVKNDPFDVPGIGRIAIVTDPAGAAVGLITPAADS
ncbi:MAG: VOC family protein [Alphaproteobacteria bacterium]|nr:MAG: VOC family protein [Alphaproteobacteria bacterium]